MSEILTVQSLTVGYGSKKILADVAFAVTPGQFIGVIAPNGTGKSTLLKTIAGILPPLMGTILLEGKPLSFYSRRELAKRIAVVGSEMAAVHYTALQMVLMGRFAHIPRFSNAAAKDQAIVQAAMEDVGIWDKRHCLCDELSQGEKQKVIIARALCQQPELLLLDEPTAHLDICNQFGILQLIKNVASRNKIAVIAVLHDINLALQFSTHLMFLKNGRLLAYGEHQSLISTDILKILYDMDFTLYQDAAATYVRPNWAVDIDI
jgi:iron complex transport system ATP-binding protein